MLNLIFSLSFLLSAHAKPVDVSEPPIKKGTMVQVESYNEKSKTYDIVMPKYEAQGPNYATVKDMIAAISTLDANRVTANPRSIVGNEYVLDNDLKLQPGAAIEALRQPPQPKKPAKAK